MKRIPIYCFLLLFIQSEIIAQPKANLKVPVMPNQKERMVNLQQQWDAVQKTPPQLGVRDCFLFLLDALDTKFLQPKDIQYVLKLVQARMISNPAAGRSYGNIFWGWHETGFDIGDGNNIEFCLQYGLPIKFLFNDRLSEENRKTLDDIFTLGIKGCRNQEVRISYTNIYLMKIWNFAAYGQIYNQPEITEEGRKYFDKWLYHVSRYGNREYDSPTYCGVDLESLLLINRYIIDPDIKAKATDALTFFMNDLSSHYNPKAGILAGAHSRDYNRVFSRDLLEEKYFNPILGSKNTNLQLFNELCLATLKEIGLSTDQKKWMNQKNRFIVQRWDSLAQSFACDFVANKFSMASSNQAYSPDDKPFVMYLSSTKKPAMPNIAFVMEGRDDHYGTWGATGMGDKMKHLMPPNYPANGGWGKTRHLMPFMQSAQNKNEMVMLVSGMKDHNCIKDYLNSTIILADYLDEIWLGNKKITKPDVGANISLDETQTFFARFEDVVFAFRFLYSNADKSTRPFLYNDGFQYNFSREKFPLQHKAALRLTLQHPNNGKADIAIWWKAEEGVINDKMFARFRKNILEAAVNVQSEKNVLEVTVQTAAGKLGVKADLLTKKRLEYYNPVPLPVDFLFNINGTEIGKPVMGKYAQMQNK